MVNVETAPCLSPAHLLIVPTGVMVNTCFSGGSFSGSNTQIATKFYMWIASLMVSLRWNFGVNTSTIYQTLSLNSQACLLFTCEGALPVQLIAHTTYYGSILWHATHSVRLFVNNRTCASPRADSYYVKFWHLTYWHVFGTFQLIGLKQLDIWHIGVCLHLSAVNIDLKQLVLRSWQYNLKRI